MRHLIMVSILLGHLLFANANAHTNNQKSTHHYGNGMLDKADFQPAGKFEQFFIKSLDGKTRPFVIYTPNLNDKNPRPLLVYLHGAINMDEIRSDPIATAKKNQILHVADKGGYYVLFPYGQKGATWFDQVGTQMVKDEITWAKKQLPIDPNKIFMSGFSDGASGTLYIAHSDGDDFAGFLAFNGSLAVATSLGESQLYPENLNQKPLYIVNTQSDMLYPDRMMTPTIDYLKKYNPNLQYQNPVGGHNMGYLPDMLDDLQTFIEKNHKQFTANISLETADNKNNRFEWLSITGFDFQQPKQNFHHDYQLTMHNDKASFGVKRDSGYQGQGIKVAGFGDHATAKNLGVEIGDVIVKLGDVTLDHPYASYNYLSDKKAGDDTSVTVLRGDQTLVLTGKFNAGYDYPVFEHKQPSAKIQANLNGNTLTINTSKVASFRVDFEQMPIKNQKITLNINGKSQIITATGNKEFKVN